MTKEEFFQHRENHSKKLYSPKSLRLFLLCSSYDNCSKEEEKDLRRNERGEDDDDHDEKKKDKIK